MVVQSRRQDRSFLGQWWWTIDRIAFGMIVMLLLFGGIMVATASPAVADRIGVGSFYFAKRQLVYLAMSFTIILSLSFLSPTILRRVSILGFLFFSTLMIVLLFYGDTAKGATRWLYLGSISLQPSEFIKPCLSVVVAWLLSNPSMQRSFLGYKLTAMVYCFTVGLLILQPDFGMVVTISVITGGQLFIAGLPIPWIGIAGVIALVGIIIAYLSLPHVAERINNFLDADLVENYQVKKSLEAFSSGGFFGKGPGEGAVKNAIPDAHSDFIFSVAGEELGIIACMLLVMMFAFIVIRMFFRIKDHDNLFVVYASLGLTIQFAIQAIINMGVTLHLLPTKGMTLPFVSYGGSSMLAMALTIGMLLSFTRKRYGRSYLKRHV